MMKILTKVIYIKNKKLLKIDDIDVNETLISEIELYG